MKVPFEIASTPFGTATLTSKVALSVGWSLDGNHQEAISGSPMARAPSGVFVHAVKPLRSFTVDGLSA